MDKTYKQLVITDRLGNPTHITDNRGNLLDFSGIETVYKTDWRVIYSGPEGFIARIPEKIEGTWRNNLGPLRNNLGPRYATPTGFLDTIELLDYLDSEDPIPANSHAEVVAEVLQHTETMGLSVIIDRLSDHRHERIQENLEAAKRRQEQYAMESIKLQHERLTRKWQARLDMQPEGLVFQVRLDGDLGPQNTNKLEFMRGKEDYILRFSHPLMSPTRPNYTSGATNTIPFVGARAKFNNLASYLASTAKGGLYSLTALTVPISEEPKEEKPILTTMKINSPNSIYRPSRLDSYSRATVRLGAGSPL